MGPSRGLWRNWHVTHQRQWQKKTRRCTFNLVKDESIISLYWQYWQQTSFIFPKFPITQCSLKPSHYLLMCAEVTAPGVHLPNRTAAEGAGPVAPPTLLLSNVLSVSFHSQQPALRNRPPCPIVGGAAVTYHAPVRDFGDGRHRGSNWMSQSSTAALWQVRGAWRWDATGKWGFLKVSGAGRAFGITHTIPVSLCCPGTKGERVMPVDWEMGWVNTQAINKKWVKKEELAFCQSEEKFQIWTRFMYLRTHKSAHASYTVPRLISGFITSQDGGKVDIMN